MIAIGYIRVSTEEQARDKKSLLTQERKVKEFCKLKDYNLERIYKDEGCSGKNLKRPAIKLLLERLKDRKNKVDVVIVYKLDRLSRRQRDLWYLLDDVFKKKEIDFVSVTESFDTTTAFGRAMFGMLGVFAELQRDEIADRTKSALRHKRESGKRISGKIPYGFKLVNEKDLIAVKEEQKVIKRMQQLRLKGLSYAKIADRLNEENIPTKNSGEWHTSTVQQILKRIKERGRIK